MTSERKWTVEVDRNLLEQTLVYLAKHGQKQIRVAGSERDPVLGFIRTHEFVVEDPLLAAVPLLGALTMVHGDVLNAEARMDYRKQPIRPEIEEL